MKNNLHSNFYTEKTADFFYGLSCLKSRKFNKNYKVLKNDVTLYKKFENIYTKFYYLIENDKDKAVTDANNFHKEIIQSMSNLSNNFFEYFDKLESPSILDLEFALKTSLLIKPEISFMLFQKYLDNMYNQIIVLIDNYDIKYYKDLLEDIKVLSFIDEEYVKCLELYLCHRVFKTTRNKVKLLWYSMYQDKVPLIPLSPKEFLENFSQKYSDILNATLIQHIEKSSFSIQEWIENISQIEATEKVVENLTAYLPNAPENIIIKYLTPKVFQEHPDKIELLLSSIMSFELPKDCSIFKNISIKDKISFKNLLKRHFPQIENKYINRAFLHSLDPEHSFNHYYMYCKSNTIFDMDIFDLLYFSIQTREQLEKLSSIPFAPFYVSGINVNDETLIVKMINLDYTPNKNEFSKKLRLIYKSVKNILDNESTLWNLALLDTVKDKYLLSTVFRTLLLLNPNKASISYNIYCSDLEFDLISAYKEMKHLDFFKDNYNKFTENFKTELYNSLFLGWTNAYLPATTSTFSYYNFSHKFDLLERFHSHQSLDTFDTLLDMLQKYDPTLEDKGNITFLIKLILTCKTLKQAQKIFSFIDSLEYFHSLNDRNLLRTFFTMSSTNFAKKGEISSLYFYENIMNLEHKQPNSLHLARKLHHMHMFAYWCYKLNSSVHYFSYISVDELDIKDIPKYILSTTNYDTFTFYNSFLECKKEKKLYEIFEDVIPEEYKNILTLFEEPFSKDFKKINHKEIIIKETRIGGGQNGPILLALYSWYHNRFDYFLGYLFENYQPDQIFRCLDSLFKFNENMILNYREVVVKCCYFKLNEEVLYDIVNKDVFNLIFQIDTKLFSKYFFNAYASTFLTHKLNVKKICLNQKYIWLEYLSKNTSFCSENVIFDVLHLANFLDTKVEKIFRIHCKSDVAEYMLRSDLKPTWSTSRNMISIDI